MVALAAALLATAAACIQSAYGVSRQPWYSFGFFLSLLLAVSIPGRGVDWAVFTALEVLASVARPAAVFWYYAAAFRGSLAQLTWIIVGISTYRTFVVTTTDMMELLFRVLLIAFGVTVALCLRRLIMRLLLSELLRASIEHRIQTALLYDFVGRALTAPFAWADSTSLELCCALRRCGRLAWLIDCWHIVRIHADHLFFT